MFVGLLICIHLHALQYPSPVSPEIGVADREAAAPLQHRPHHLQRQTRERTRRRVFLCAYVGRLDGHVPGMDERAEEST